MDDNNVNENLSVYERVRAVPEDAKSEIATGRMKGKTSINPMWRIKTLTELFGMCGVGWWYDVTKMWTELCPDTGEIAAFVNINLYVVDPKTKETSHAIFGTGGSKFVANEKNGKYLSNEAYKMALTDALSVAAKSLGMGADVYWNTDGNKYDKPQQDNQYQNQQPRQNYSQKSKNQNRNQNQQQKPNVTYSQTNSIRCQCCGRPLPTDYVSKDTGEILTQKQFADQTRKLTGQVLCVKCITDWNEETQAQDKGYFQDAVGYDYSGGDEPWQEIM